MRLSVLLDCHSYFSFGMGASSPSRLIERAAELGYSAVALVDDNGVYGAVEAQQAGRNHGVKVLIGATVQLKGDTGVYPLSLIAMNRTGYEVLCNLLTTVHADDEKLVPLSVLLAHTDNLICVTGGRNGFPTRLLAERKVVQAEQLLTTLKGAFPERLYVQLYYGAYPHDLLRARKLRDFARGQRVPVVSAPEVRYATPDLHPLYDTLVCARLGVIVRDPTSRGRRTIVWRFPIPVCGTAYRSTLCPSRKVWRTLKRSSSRATSSYSPSASRPRRRASQVGRP